MAGSTVHGETLQIFGGAGYAKDLPIERSAVGPLSEALSAAGERFAASVALEGPRAPLTYRDLAQMASDLGGRLRARALESDEPVVLLVPNRPEIQTIRG